MEYHIPVLLDESVSGLKIKSGEVFVDATFGGGGHSKKILENLSKQSRLYAFDRDFDAPFALLKDPRLIPVRSNYRHLESFIDYYKEDGVDGILADLGVSSHQLDTGQRGFGYRWEAPLDMRMNSSQKLTAADVINNYNESALLQIFSRYGEIRNSKTLARKISAAVSQAPIQTTGQLIELTENVVIGNRAKYLAQLFQALRIEVNMEMESLGQFLEASARVLNPGGRLVVITYHSIEDRMVKRFIQNGGYVEEEKDEFVSRPRLLSKVNRKPILPSEEEVRNNPRSRSAKLRIAEKEGHDEKDTKKRTDRN